MHLKYGFMYQVNLDHIKKQLICFPGKNIKKYQYKRYDFLI